MNRKYFIGILSVIMILTTIAGAVPANPSSFTLTQPDGTTLQARQIGDERQSHFETLDGYTMIQNSDGYWVYAVTNETVLLPTQNKVGKANIKNLNFTKHLAPKRIVYESSDNHTVNRIGKISYSPTTIGTTKAIVILIGFTDAQASSTHTPSYFNNLLFSTSSGAKSLTNYYNEVSYNQLNIVGTASPKCYTSSHTMSYYGADSSTGIDDVNGRISKLAEEAISLAANDINFAQYDGDGDGVVDHVIIIHAGNDQASSGVSKDIWSHQRDLNMVVDGVRINSYTMLAEGSPLGTFAHEFGHDIGLPDLYNTDTGSGVVWDWDLMDDGSWNNNGNTPAHPSAWSKIQLGWITPITVTTQTTVNIPQLETNQYNSVYKISSSNMPSTEYFLVENRQKTGFDSYLPDDGIVIWHIDEAQGSLLSNDINNGIIKHVAVESESIGLTMLGDAAYSSNDWQTTFSPTSYPNSNSNAGISTGIFIYNIGSSGSSMSVSFSKTGTPTLSSPTLLYPGGPSCCPLSSWEWKEESINTLTPTFQWNSVPGADYYGLYIWNEDRNTPAFDTRGMGITITGTAYTLPSGILQYGEHYRWSIRSFSSTTGLGNSSKLFYFQTSLPDTSLQLTLHEIHSVYNYFFSLETGSICSPAQTTTGLVDECYAIDILNNGNKWTCFYSSIGRCYSPVEILNIGNGWTITIVTLDPPSKQAWLLLRKDGIKMDDMIVSMGEIYTGVYRECQTCNFVPLIAIYVEGFGHTHHTYYHIDTVKIKYMWFGENQPPVASFTYSLEKPNVGEEITFDASASSDSDGAIIQYKWNFGDGYTPEGKVKTHVYGKAGNYTVTLNVTDNNAQQNSMSKVLEVKAVSIIPKPTRTPTITHPVSQAESITSEQDYMEQQFVSNGSFPSGLSDLIYRMRLEIIPASGNFQVSKVIIYNTTAIDTTRTYYQIDDVDKGKGTISVFPNRIEWQGQAETPAEEFELGIYASSPYKLNIPFSSTRLVTKETFSGEDTVEVSFSVTPSQNLDYLGVSTFAEETNDIYSLLLTNTATNTIYLQKISSDEVKWSFGNLIAGTTYTGSVQLRTTPKNSGIARYWTYTRIEARDYSSYAYLNSGHGAVMVRYTDTVIGDVEIYFVNPVDYQISANGKGIYYQRFREYSEVVTNGESATIKIDDNFKPGIRTVPAGSTVTWKNNDPISHTIVSNTGLWSSPSLGQYQQFSYTFNTPGTYDYSCSDHPSMTGKVIVTASASTTPTPPTGTVVSIANVTTTQNSNVTRPIIVENVNNMAAATIWLTYDPTVVNVLSVSAGDLGGVTTNIDNTIGKVTMLAFSTTAKSGSVTFANVMLRAVGQINATSSLTLTVPSLADQNGAPISRTIKSGTFTISSVIKGDVNGDNQVTVVDALFVAQYTVGLRTLNSQQLAAADVNNDGQVTIVDALFIAQYTVGLRQL